MTPTLTDRKLVWLVAAMMCLQPLATDLYLASLPALKQHFALSQSAVQLTLTVYIAVFGLGQLIVGPISDRFGRRPVALFGLALYIVGSLLASFTPHFWGMLVARVAQAIGTCCTSVCARALVRDSREPAQGAPILGSSLTLMAVVPIVAPILGGYAQSYLGWRANFLIITSVSALVLFFCWRQLPESNLYKNSQATQWRTLLSNYLDMLRSPTLRAFALGSTFAFGSLFSFISGSAFIIIEVLKLPPHLYGYCFAVASFGFVVGASIMKRVLPKKGVKGVLAIGAGISVASSGTMLLLALAGIQNLASFMVPIFGVMVSHGFINPTTQAGAIGPFPEKAGAAAALVGFVMYAFAILVGTMVGASFNGTTLPISIIIFVMTCCGAFCHWVLVPRLKL